MLNLNEIADLSSTAQQFIWSIQEQPNVQSLIKTLNKWDIEANHNFKDYGKARKYTIRGWFDIATDYFQLVAFFRPLAL